MTHHHDLPVDKNNTEGHCPGANVNYINLCLLCQLFGPTTQIKVIKGQSKVSKGQKRPENTVTAATVY